MPTYRAAAIADSTLERAYGHAIHQAFYELPNVELVALADPVAEPRAERAAEIGNPKQYDDYRDNARRRVARPGRYLPAPLQTPRTLAARRH